MSADVLRGLKLWREEVKLLESRTRDRLLLLESLWCRVSGGVMSLVDGRVIVLFARYQQLSVAKVTVRNGSRI